MAKNKLWEEAEKAEKEKNDIRLQQLKKENELRLKREEEQRIEA